MNEIFVKSHVARDLLQTAGLFADVPKAVWEYVVNGLEYVDPGINPIVRVAVEKSNRRITVSDNGRGMDLDGTETISYCTAKTSIAKQDAPDVDVSELASPPRLESRKLFGYRLYGTGSVALPN